MTERRPIADPNTLSGDLDQVYTALRQRLYQYLVRQVSDAMVAEDLLHEVFAKALRAIQADRAPSNLSGWLYAAARTTVIDHYRVRKPELEPLDENQPHIEPVDDESMHQALAACLRPMALKLPPIYRDTLVATDFDGRTMQSVAEEAGVSLSAIKSRASRGRRMLKAKLLECCAVEFSGGLVRDYHPHSTKPCGCKQGDR